VEAAAIEEEKTPLQHHPLWKQCSNSLYDVSVSSDDEAVKPGDFNSFKTKYLADTVAVIKAKQKK
jgi:hypothetical protein